MRYIVLFTCLLGLPQTACAVQEPCSREQAIKAEENIDELDNWKKVYNAFELYHHCDDGSIGEGFSSSVSVLLANSWEQFNALNKLTMQSGKFKRFILNHLDETMPLDEYVKIKKNVTVYCPDNANGLCEEIDSKLTELRKKSMEIDGVRLD